MFLRGLLSLKGFPERGFCLEGFCEVFFLNVFFGDGFCLKDVFSSPLSLPALSEPCVLRRLPPKAAPKAPGPKGPKSMLTFSQVQWEEPEIFCAHCTSA